MGLWELITGRKKGLLDLPRAELRQQELLLAKERDRLVGRIEKLAADKQALFRRGAETQSPEVRRALAAEFEARTNEQILFGRQLNIKSKELLTVARVRLARENRDRSEKMGLGRMSEGDLVRLTRMIEDDAVSAELYGRRLDELLGAAGEADRAAVGEPTDAVASLMHVWEKMDAGRIADAKAAYTAADAEVRQQAERRLAEP